MSKIESFPKETCSIQVPFHGRDKYGNRVIRYFDMENFIEYIINNCNDRKLEQLGYNVTGFFAEVGRDRMIINNIPNAAQSHYPYYVFEISIYILDNGEFKNKDIYVNLDMCKDSLWDEFLEKLSSYMGGSS